ncbi:(+)-neomenthol dehydrogenase-like isoform X2 [Rhododendron vialii]|uniref:(+)-neomenthol dehydrogenase-like isoform X2 n=1 Tax=Rhododendron vialii TaxID=182163 RepID=UPI00265FAB41|nr:(+)-neomenthol dehydrogenase-like isoform X2 [Rhododendron vialii]
MEAAGITQSTKKVALVTGSNKGIGLEICRQLASNGVVVILTARDENKGLEAVQNLKARGQSDILFHQLDVTNQTSIASLAEFIKTKFKKLDILVNNAGVGTTIDPAVQKGLNLRIFDDIAGPEAKKLREVLNQSCEAAEACLRTNYYGVKLVTEELIPLLQLSDSPRIVNVSSTLGQLKLISNEKAKKELSDIESLTVEKVDELVQEFAKDLKEDKLEARGWPIIFSAYIVSKAALNGYTRVLAKNYPNMAINAVSPGYVKTDLNHNNGILTVEQGAKGPVMLALVDDGGPSGLFYDQMEVSTF